MDLWVKMPMLYNGKNANCSIRWPNRCDGDAKAISLLRSLLLFALFSFYNQ